MNDIVILDPSGNPLVRQAEPEPLPPDPVAPVNPFALLEMAIRQGTPPDQLKQLMDLQERWERAEAAKAFSRAVTAFQAECPTVFKRRTAEVKDKFSYQFAGYDDIMSEAAPILAKHAITVTFSTAPAGEKAIQCTCRVRVGTHVEDTTLTVPVPVMTVNDTQRFGAALSYAKRYAFCAALNIVVTDEDDDGATLMETLTVEEAAKIEALIKEKRVNREKFLEWAQVASVEDMSRSKYAQAVHLLKQKKDR